MARRNLLGVAAVAAAGGLVAGGAFYCLQRWRRASREAVGRSQAYTVAVGPNASVGAASAASTITTDVRQQSAMVKMPLQATEEEESGPVASVHIGTSSNSSKGIASSAAVAAEKAASLPEAALEPICTAVATPASPAAPTTPPSSPQSRPAVEHDSSVEASLPKQEYLALVGLQRAVLVERLGAGEQGFVDLVKVPLQVDEETEYQAARKTVPRKNVSGDRFFELEVACMRAGAGCPHAAQLLGVASYEDRHEIMMELGDRTLHDLMVSSAKSRPSGTVLQVPEPQLQHIARSLLRGLQHFHERKLVHLDIKPQNVVFAGDRVMLIDFGCMSPITESGDVKNAAGSFDYMAPETKRAAASLNSRRVGDRADIYSLGLVLLEAAVCVDCDGLRTKYAQRSVPLPSCVPAGLASLLTAMLEKNPAKRISAAMALQHPYLQDVMVM